MSRQAAKRSPQWQGPKSLDQVLDDLTQVLQDEFYLAPLATYTVVVEGWTDVKYIARAVELTLAATGCDLLHAAVQGVPSRISIITPGTKGHPSRGGTPQMARLAKAIQPLQFTFQHFAGVAFVYDGDEAGEKAGRDLEPLGHKCDHTYLTLTSNGHPGACRRSKIVIEDLLSLRIQQLFFDRGDSWCTARYEAGKIQNFDWGGPSKGPLLDFVSEHATLADLWEVARVVTRVRRMWGLPTDPLFDAESYAPAVVAEAQNESTPRHDPSELRSGPAEASASE